MNNATIETETGKSCLIMVVTHGSGEFGDKTNEIDNSLVEKALQEIDGITEQYDTVHIGFDGDQPENPPAVIAIRLFNKFTDKGGKLIQSQGVNSNYSLPLTSNDYKVDEDKFLTLCYRDEGGRDEVFPPHANRHVDINTGMDKNKYGGTDDKGNLAGSSLAWNILVPTIDFIDENTDIFLLVIWDEVKAQSETKNGEPKPGRGFKGSITEKTLTAVNDEVFTINGKKIKPLVYFKTQGGKRNKSRKSKNYGNKNRVNKSYYLKKTKKHKGGAEQIARIQFIDINNNNAYYQILGIPNNASQDDIKRAYRKLVIKIHPDKNGQSRDSINANQLLNEAHETLKDQTTRNMYDLHQAQPPPQPPPPPPPQPPPPPPTPSSGPLPSFEQDKQTIRRHLGSIGDARREYQETYDNGGPANIEHFKDYLRAIGVRNIDQVERLLR